jgi:hypothetical protein
VWRQQAIRMPTALAECDWFLKWEEIRTDNPSSGGLEISRKANRLSGTTRNNQ